MNFCLLRTQYHSRCLFFYFNAEKFPLTTREKIIFRFAALLFRPKSDINWDY